MTGRAVASAGALLERREELLRLRRRAIAGPERTPWEPRPLQVPPPPSDWYLWLMLGGRGAGKTDGCADYFDRYMTAHAGTRGRIIAPTLGDAVTSCVEGPSGLKAHNPRVALIGGAGGLQVRWPNGSVAKLFGAYTQEDVERLRAGGNSALDWWEELAAWRFLGEAVDQAELGLRTGSRSHAVASTTPKPRAKLREIIRDPKTVVTHGTTDDNPYLPLHIRERLQRKYAGTRLGRQELMGELIDDVEGALWTGRMIDGARLKGELPDMARVVVAVDPSGGDEAGNDEQGIVVAGLGVDGLGYVLADRSCKLSPLGWGKRAIRAFAEFAAGEVVAERNFGGDMVTHTLEVAAQQMNLGGVKVEVISASRGKLQRAEPVAALYEQGRVRHAEVFDELEQQLLNWTPESGWSPDRMDALVWALTRLMVEPEPVVRWLPA